MFALCRFRGAAFALSLIALAPIPAGAQSGGALQGFVDKLIAASNALLQPSGDAQQKCRALLAWAYDVPAMARTVSGQAWTKANAAERSAFQAAFEQSVVAGCARFAAGERDALLTFAGTRDGGNGDQLAAVRVNAPGKNERTWIWRIRPAGNSFRVVDAIVDGRSLVASERQEIAQILEAAEFNLGAATEYLRKRAAR